MQNMICDPKIKIKTDHLLRNIKLKKNFKKGYGQNTLKINTTPYPSNLQNLMPWDEHLQVSILFYFYF